MKHELPELPYAMNALEPHISQETLEYHYGKHHAGYINKLNIAIEGTAFENMSLANIVKNSAGPTFNNAAQAWNHNFYWNCLSPDGGGEIRDENLARSIEQSFGDFDAFKEQFNNMAVTNFGSGWTWLVLNEEGGLEVVNTGNADTPLTGSKVPLLTCDVWEHAYYIDYRNERAKYLESFWNIVNWEFVANTLCP